MVCGRQSGIGSGQIGRAELATFQRTDDIGAAESALGATRGYGVKAGLVGHVRNYGLGWRLAAAGMLAALFVGGPGGVHAAGIRAAFLAELVPLGQDAPEARAALDLCKRVAETSVLIPGGDGSFRDREGSVVAVGGFPVLWFHQGDHTRQDGPVYSTSTLRVLEAYVRAGGGLFLSGSALSMVELLGVEPVSPRRGGPGSDSVQAALVPLIPGHPVFRGLGSGIIPVSSAGYPAFSDFHASGGPAGGMLLARSPSGSENPLVEYALGQGRIIAMGWRLPHYANQANRYRGNLETLTANILAYLGDSQAWRDVKITTRRPGAGPERDTISAEEREALGRAIDDLTRTFGSENYPRGAVFRQRFDALREEYAKRAKESGKEAEAQDPPLRAWGERFRELQRDALLANPLLSSRRVLAIRRRAGRLGLPRNWQSNSSLPRSGYDNRIVVLSLPASAAAEVTAEPIYEPKDGTFVGDMDLHFDGKKLLFSKSDPNGPWRIFEFDLANRTLEKLPLIDEPDVDNYDACYLPDGNVIFTSTAPFVGVPCVKGSSHVANLFLLRRPAGTIRQLTFDQDHDWCPTLLNNGRVLYLRWEYSDLPHFVSRILFHMNPDGTGQAEYYGSNSYWPNAMFYARPIPWHPTRFVAIVGGHHDDPRMGEMVLFDPALGRHEAAGVIQRIPGFGEKVEPVILDGLVKGSWPKFLHPYPLGNSPRFRDRPAFRYAAGRYFLVSARPTPAARWGIYLVDVFGNLLRLIDRPGFAYLEPMLLEPVFVPPVIPDKTDPSRRDALVFLQDIYRGPGLAGVPRGEVKKLRLITYHFAYHGMGGQINRVGLDGPWDIKRVLGTVPVQPDGSACFPIPANTPVAVQPLDRDGKALQLMRSWFAGMPGETLSCVGCHEKQNTPPSDRNALALRTPPTHIEPWYGPTRGFSFVREVQPVLDRYCLSCHDGRPAEEGPARPDFRDREPVHPRAKAAAYNQGTRFTPSYMALRRYVRTPTIESDMHLLMPGEFHADNSRLVQLLRAGHHGVKLPAEAWDRIVTWIDLNAPAHGTWTEIVGEKAVSGQRARRRAMMARYAGRDEDPEAIPPSECFVGLPSVPTPSAIPATTPAEPGDGPPSAPANPPSPRAAPKEPREIDLGKGVSLTLVRVPAGNRGASDGFWIGRTEVTNEQFARFDPEHDSRFEPGDFLQFSVQERGYPVNLPKQPVVRIPWDRAVAFCEWLAARTGESFVLPTEEEWEYACRAGTVTAMWYGDPATDFRAVANLADASLLAVDTFGFGLPSGAIPPWRPAVAAVNDGHRVSAPVAGFQPNPWGLYDVHGNAAEWTSTPAEGALEGADLSPEARMIVRGGSWYDRPERARCGVRTSYRRYLGLFDVGFRVVSRSP